MIKAANEAHRENFDGAGAGAGSRGWGWGWGRRRSVLGLGQRIGDWLGEPLCRGGRFV